jgi:hypothetical protein
LLCLYKIQILLGRKRNLFMEELCIDVDFDPGLHHSTLIQGVPSFCFYPILSFLIIIIMESLECFIGRIIHHYVVSTLNHLDSEHISLISYISLTWPNAFYIDHVEIFMTKQCTKIFLFAPHWTFKPCINARIEGKFW